MIRQASPLAFPAFLAFLAVAALAAPVPVRFAADVTQAQTHQATAYRGETLEIEAALTDRGRPLTNAAPAALYWQTNGMESAWWTAPAAMSGGVVRATWSPSNDVGAAAYRLFFAVDAGGRNYRANMTLRMVGSPGAEPNALPPPVRVLDFAGLDVRNPPWPDYRAGDNIVITNGVISSTASGGGGGAVSSVNGKTGAVVLEAADIESGFGDSVMEELSVIAGIADGAAARAVDAESMAGGALTGVETLAAIKAGRPSTPTAGNLASLTEDGDLEDSGIAMASVIHANSYGKVEVIDVESLFLSSLNNVGVYDTGLSLRAELDPLAPRDWVVETIGGTSTWMEVSGPRLSLKTSPGGGATNTMWTSSGELEPAVSNLTALVAALSARVAQLENRPDLTSWGRFAPDGTPNPDPDYMLFLNSPATVFGSGFSWEQSGSYFCLMQSGSVAFAGSATNGQVRFGVDSTNYFGIVQGGSVTVGARVNSFSVDGDGAHMTVAYGGGDFPVVWFTASLMLDFAELTGAQVAWVDNGDGTATCSAAATGPAGFYKMTTSRETGARFHVNMPLKAAGGVVGGELADPVVYDSTIEISSGGHTYRIPAELAE